MVSAAGNGPGWLLIIVPSRRGPGDSARAQAVTRAQTSTQHESNVDNEHDPLLGVESVKFLQWRRRLVTSVTGGHLTTAPGPSLPRLES